MSSQRFRISPLQAKLLHLAAHRVFLRREEILLRFFDWPLCARMFEVEPGKFAPLEPAQLRPRVLAQCDEQGYSTQMYFEKVHKIDRRRYQTAHASVSRSIRRLTARGLLSNDMITPAGVAWLTKQWPDFDPEAAAAKRARFDEERRLILGRFGIQPTSASPTAR
jgi:hypothetical protein